MKMAEMYSEDRRVAASALEAALPHIMERMDPINRLLEAGYRRDAIEQFHALASVAIRTQRADLSCQGFMVQGRTTEISVCRIPAEPRLDKPIALFLPGVMTFLPLTAVRALTFIDRFDLVLCELPGHGASGQVSNVSLATFAEEYAVLIDGALRRAAGLFVIGESLGGLVALALARLRPRLTNVILIDTPFHLTRPELATWIGECWRAGEEKPYVRRICMEIMGFDPRDGCVQRTMLHHGMVRDAPFNCLLIMGGDQQSSGIPSVVTDGDIAALRAANPAILMTPRVPGSGHAVLLDNPDGAWAALQQYIVDRTIAV
jgi:pimeloyl-ACP methyl ester carboxylesterase